MQTARAKTSLAIERDLGLPMRRGVHLFACLYRPTVSYTEESLAWCVVGKLDNEFRLRPVTASTSGLLVIRPERSTRDPLVLRALYWRRRCSASWRPGFPRSARFRLILPYCCARNERARARLLLGIFSPKRFGFSKYLSESVAAWACAKRANVQLTR